MSTTEALRLQLDALRTENQELEAENAKLKRQRNSSELEESMEITEELRKENEQLQQDVGKLKQLYEEILRARQSKQTGEAREVAEISTLEERLKEEIEERIVHVKRAENMQQEIEMAAQCCNELEETERRLKEESESLRHELRVSEDNKDNLHIEIEKLQDQLVD